MLSTMATVSPSPETSDYSDYDINVTDPSGELCDMEVNSEQEWTIKICVYSLICTLGLLGNVLVLVTYAFYRKAKTMTDVYLVNLALADLLLVVALPLFIYNEQYEWKMGTWACKLLTGTYSINLYCSMLLLACISVDRYIAIVKASRSIGIRAKAQIYSRLICSTIWLFAVALSMPIFIFGDRDKDPHDGTVKCILSFENWAMARLMKIMVPSTQVTVGFLIPMIVMGFCYCNILLTLLKAQNYQRHKAVRVVLAVVIVFILCQLPYNVFLLVQTEKKFKEGKCEAQQNISLALSITKIVAYLHCCLNPILYAFIGVKFRNHFCKIMEDLWCLGRQYFSSARSSQHTSELYIPAHKTNYEPIHENPS